MGGFTNLVVNALKNRGDAIRSLFSACRLILRSAALVAVLWGASLTIFTYNLPLSEQPIDDKTKTDAIVVLTGGQDRLAEGLKLLASGHAEKLLVSGVHSSVTLSDLARVHRFPLSRLSCCVVLGYAAASTQGNAQETAAWMAQEHYTSLRLVTSYYHMPRSVLELKEWLPSSIRVIPHPVIPHDMVQDVWWKNPKTRQLMVAEHNKYLVALIRALLS